MADLKEGDLVYYWDGDERPEKPRIGYFAERLKDGRFGIKASSMMGPFIWDHVEPFYKSERWTDDAGDEIKPGDAVEVWDYRDSHKYIGTFIRKAECGYVTVSGDLHLPHYWLHAKKVPEVPKGALVLVWDNEDDPDKPARLAFYDGSSEDGRHSVRKDDGTTYLVDNVRPVTSEDLKRWAGGE